MKTNRVLKVLGLGMVLGLSLVSCRPEVNDPRNFPTANSFTPGTAKTGDTVKVTGNYLKGSKVTLNGTAVTLAVDSDELLAFVVTDALTASNPNGVFELGVEFTDGSKTRFSQTVVLNHVITLEDKQGWLSASLEGAGDTLGKGPTQMLITDFDGHGVRTANTVTNADDFDKTQFSALVKTGGDQQITIGFRGLEPSPALHNYLALVLEPKFVENGKNGFAGEFISRSELQNDRATPWPKSFVELPNSDLTYPANNAALNNMYINFYIHKNDLPKGVLDVYLFNDELPLGNQYRYRVPIAAGLSEWQLVSIKVRDFKDNYGFGGSITANTFKNTAPINKIKFNFTHDDKKDETANPSTWVTNATGEVFIAIDHITITQGGPFIAYPNNL